MKKETLFNEIIRKVRKDHFGKGPERIKTIFIDNMAISILHGNLTPTEKFIAQTPQGAEIIHSARTKMIQRVYDEKIPDGLEELMGAKLLYLFSDIKVEEDMGVSVFIFDRKIDQD